VRVARAYTFLSYLVLVFIQGRTPLRRHHRSPLTRLGSCIFITDSYKVLEENSCCTCVTKSPTNGKEDYGHGHGPRASQEERVSRRLELTRTYLCLPVECSFVLSWLLVSDIYFLRRRLEHAPNSIS